MEEKEKEVQVQVQEVQIVFLGKWGKIFAFVFAVIILSMIALMFSLAIGFWVLLFYIPLVILWYILIFKVDVYAPKIKVIRKDM